MTKYAVGWKQASMVTREQPKPFDEMAKRVKQLNAAENARKRKEEEETAWIGQQFEKSLPF